jgi:outer membrane protein OmpA-like peptidoglycan-associated protein
MSTNTDLRIGLSQQDSALHLARHSTPAFEEFFAMGPRNFSIAAGAVALMLSTAALAERVKREGVIISGSPNGLNVRTREGPITVVVSPDTRIRQVKGLSRSTRSTRDLIPGLIIKIDGDQQGSTIAASNIDFKESDWRNAIATKAGTQQEFAELRQAIIDGNEYVIREETTVYFKSGSAVIAESYKQNLRALAQKAPSYGNYRVSILGFADPRGNAAANERLSLRRAGMVSNFLRQTGSIQPGRVLSPSAMGEGTAAPGEAAPPASDDEARRVVVRVVTPKAQLGQQ